jgi:hypothetical protein
MLTLTSFVRVLQGACPAVAGPGAMVRSQRLPGRRGCAIIRPCLAGRPGLTVSPGDPPIGIIQHFSALGPPSRPSAATLA